MINTFTIKRIFKLGLVNFWRNRWLSLAASLMIMLTLLTMGIFALLNIFTNSTAEGIKDRIDLSVYFYENATDSQIKDLQYTLANRADVKNVRYVSKEEALSEWAKRAINARVGALITKDSNPLPRSLNIKANNPEALQSIASYLSGDQYKPYVRQISYEETKTAINRIIKWTKFVRTLGLGLTLFLLAISLVVILNTIRLTVFTRKDEVEIMRLVGANGNFIRIPFSVEAVLYGFMGGLLAYLLICGLMSVVGTRLATSFSDVMSPVTPYFYLIQPYFDSLKTGHHVGFAGSVINLWQLGLLQISIGILFSVACSMFAIRRYLKI